MLLLVLQGSLLLVSTGAYMELRLQYHCGYSDSTHSIASSLELVLRIGSQACLQLNLCESLLPIIADDCC